MYFTDTQPRYVNGRVLVPLRGVFEQMGATVNWDPYTRMVTANRGGSDVQLRIGDRMALINGSNVSLDVPAMIMGGSTMVPIRFVSEALGANVGWLEAQHLVTINTNGNGNDYGTVVTTPPQQLRRVVVYRNEVLPVTLDQTLSTTANRRGDTFTATIDQDGLGSSDAIPSGTKIEGHIAALKPMRNNNPAILDLAFDRVIFPNGRTAAVDGTLTSLDNQYVERDNNGRLVARNTSSGGSDRRMVYAGYGAGAGLLVGVLTKRPLEGAILGGALGYILGQVQHDQRQRLSNVTLNAGTQMGVRLNRDLTMSW